MIPLILTLLYISLFLTLYLGFGRSVIKSLPEPEPKDISVLVAAKNEQENICRLIDSMSLMDYPKESFELIIIDDNSDDSTFRTAFERIEEYRRQKFNFRIIKAGKKRMPAKKGALLKGIEQEKNPYIAITDADCRLEQSWLKTMSYGLEKNDIVFGLAPFIMKKSRLNSLACYENLKSSMLTFGSASFGFAYSAAARSMAYSKKAYDKSGGYFSTGDALSGDDDLLLREAARQGLKVRGLIFPGARALSDTKETFGEYFSQKARHSSTSVKYLFRHQAFLGIWHFLNFLCILSPIAAIFRPEFLLLFLIKIFTDIFYGRRKSRIFNYKFSIPRILELEAIYQAFLILAMLKGFSNVKWK